MLRRRSRPSPRRRGSARAELARGSRRRRRPLGRAVRHARGLRRRARCAEPAEGSGSSSRGRASRVRVPACPRPAARSRGRSGPAGSARASACCAALVTELSRQRPCRGRDSRGRASTRGCAGHACAVAAEVGGLVPAVPGSGQVYDDALEVVLHPLPLWLLELGSQVMREPRAGLRLELVARLRCSGPSASASARSAARAAAASVRECRR